MEQAFAFENFLGFFVEDVNGALIDALCGKTLREQHPAFARDFWTSYEGLSTFMKRLPWIFAPRPYKAREKCLAAIADWQKYASENFDETTAPACANATLNTYWCAIDVFRDRTLLEDVSKEVETCRQDNTAGSDYDLPKLLRQPLLQAVFAESLRLRCHNMFIRNTPGTINIHNWVVPRDRYVMARSTPGHMDTKVWGVPDDLPPVNTFYPGRFLKHSDEDGQLRFSMSGKETSWLPSGSGVNVCPGRHFARTHWLMDSFNVDILAGHKEMRLDLEKFGIGVLGPSGKVAACIRQRATWGIVAS